jgi:hypothetical protein
VERQRVWVVAAHQAERQQVQVVQRRVGVVAQQAEQQQARPAAQQVWVARVAQRVARPRVVRAAA